LQNGLNVTSNIGNQFAIDMIKYANEKLESPSPNPIGLRDFLGDVRYRYELYTDPNNQQIYIKVFGIGTIINNLEMLMTFLIEMMF
jgi:hypothetical protein